MGKNQKTISEELTKIEHCLTFVDEDLRRVYSKQPGLSELAYLSLEPLLKRQSDLLHDFRRFKNAIEKDLIQ